ncbi:hypothetical protein QTP70_031073 [Hemibagrus guttatus]|uniref:Uncharacterized protein n=1 Tax=Hemibagrus guttatus TaxID=175788 RepID=A0AAE0QVX4_9TELE|nr:hypothetical protein QTP70_031073 [Hemibagrus guttatus]KAK3562222.1 hypothetical protein QTP86_030901 [Hemibagrus guttatus]
MAVEGLRSPARIPLIQAMEEACDLIDAGSVQGWIYHSRRFFPRCLPVMWMKCYGQIQLVQNATFGKAWMY